MKRILFAVAVAAFAVACVDPTMPTTRTLVETSPAVLAITSVTTTTPPVPFGAVEVCKTSNAAGTFGFTVTTNAPTGSIQDEGTPDRSITIGAGGGTVCEIVYSGNTLGNAGGANTVTIVENASATPLTNIDIVRYLHPAPTYDAGVHLNDTEDEASRTAVVKINSDMSRRVTFTNTTAPPPPAVCDFITFGRLVDEVGGLKVVISGNAGGFNADGSIKGEFHIEVNGTDHHVHDIATYGPVAAPALASATFTNSRRVTGTDIHGHSVELRLWDGGEPGKDTDRYWFNVNGTIVGNATNGNLIDQGNMQYHNVCRGPDQD